MVDLGTGEESGEKQTGGNSINDSPTAQSVNATMVDLGTGEGSGEKSKNEIPSITWLLSVWEDYSVSMRNIEDGICGKYDGEVDGAGRRHGKGKMTWKGGDVYEGDWKLNRMDGWSRFKYVTSDAGSTYDGQFKEGVRDGMGKSQYPNGDAYVGWWLADEMDGNGEYLFVDGSVERKTYKYGRMYKKGVRWSKDAQTAWLVIKENCTIQLELSEATMITKSMGFVVDFP